MSYTLTIDGTDRSALLVEESLEYQDTLEGRSTMSFTLIDTTAAIDFAWGDEVGLVIDAVTVFAGTIDERIYRTPNSQDTVRWVEISCVDWNQMLDRFTVAATYTDATLAAIVTDIVDVQTDLHTEGITIGTVPTGTTLTKAVFPYMTAFDCLRDLADLSGLTWNIAPDKNLHFFEKSTFAAPFTIGDTYKMYFDAELSQARGKYRNKQILRAGTDKTDLRTEYFRGEYSSGVSDIAKRKRTFTLSYPVGEKPRIFINGSEIPAARVGIRGVDEDGIDVDDAGVPTNSTWIKWFYALDDPKISQNSHGDETYNPTLKSTDILEVRYYGLYPIVVISQLDSEITARIAVEGGSGIYEYVEEDEQVDSRDFAVEKTAMLLQQYGQVPRVLKYSTHESGLQAGQLQTITIADLGISGTEFLITSVSMRLDGKGVSTFTVTAYDSERPQGWAEFFRRMADAGRKYGIRENEKLLLARPLYENMTITDSVVTATGTNPSDYDTDIYTAAQLLTVTVATRGDTYGWGLGRSKLKRDAYGV